ncbi:N-acetylmuramoyl-L-alanine amidase [Clostridium oceanicum]|uniref:N-acetylmuramoyl-L-alanine amidase n=1 Tax=Clostridium oceanicum TaxID=1543 RepID=A0ABP3UJJ1_9CLOT
MKIGIDCGHTLSGSDYGASGIKEESRLTREVGTNVIAKLQALGHRVVKCYKDTCSSLNDSLSYRTNTANTNNVDLYVSIHFNCFNGSAYGTEVYTYQGERTSKAVSVLNNIVGLGYTNRGIKDGSNLYVIRNTKAEAMLIECCFCDNKNDMNRFNSESMANAIVKGLVGKTTSTTAGDNSSNTSNSELYRVRKSWENVRSQVGAYRVLQNAIDECRKHSGYKVFNSSGKQIYPSIKSYPVLRQGNSGEYVIKLQQMLITIGYPVGYYGSDGVFGEGTLIAVKAFQRDCNLNVDGVVGLDTWKALERNMR